MATGGALVTGPGSGGRSGGGPDAEAPEARTDPADVGRPAFDRFYVESYEDMVRLARALAGSPQHAEDLVQDAFVRMHRHWGSVREPGPYLRRCVVNACRSHHRRVGRERRHTVASDMNSGAGLAGEHLSLLRLELPDDQSRADDADELAGPLASLPYRQRAAIVLRYYADLPDAEVATALGCRVGTVASLVHRALERLREEIGHDRG
jgi:RNA polymerase sigma-70 factor (sigma-E family)